MERDYEFTSKCHLSDISNPLELGKVAAEQTIKKLSPKKIGSDKISIIFDKRISKGFLSSFAGAISASSIARGTSFLKDKVNQQIFSNSVNITDKPDLIKGMGSKCFDSEGVKTETLNLVKSGILNDYLVDTYNGKKLNLKSNGRSGGSTNLYFENGKISYRDLLKSHSKILYVTENKNFNLVIADADGKNEQVLLESPEPIISPAWSSNAEQIAYVSFENNRAQVFTQNLASGQRELIISSKSSVSSPAWSPNNKQLAFASTKDGNSEIYVIDLKTKKINRLTENLAIDTEPAWSPDGKKIIFTSDRSGSPQIYEIDIRTKLKRRLTTTGNYNARASYLNKTEIILVHRNQTDFNIASLNLNSRELSVLTSTKNDESPCIAPNGNVIIYSTKDGSLSYLAGVNISSKVSFKLPALYGELKEPAWSPFIR